MRAMVLRTHGGPLGLEELPSPEPKAGEVLVRVRACGLGLTLHWTRQGRFSGGTLPPKLPRVIGHEVAGDVVAVGEGVASLDLDDRVAVYYYLICGECRRCIGGREDLCEQLAGHVGRHVDGGLAELLCLPARNLRRLPAGVDYIAGAVAADALATPLHVLRARAAVRPGETVLVVGAGGGVGVHMVQVARALGARPLAVDIGAAKLALARDGGAEMAWDASERSFDDAVIEYTHGDGADIVVEMVGTSATVGSSLRSLSRVGRLVLVGSYEPSTPLAMTVGSFTGEQAVMSSKYCTRAELSDTLTMIAQGTLRPIVTRRCDLEEADEVLTAITHGDLPGRAVVVL